MATALQSLRFGVRGLTCRPILNRCSIKPIGKRRGISSTIPHMARGREEAFDDQDEDDFFDDGEWDDHKSAAPSEPEDPEIARILNKANRDTRTAAKRQLLERKIDTLSKRFAEEDDFENDPEYYFSNDGAEMAGYDPEVPEMVQIEEDEAAVLGKVKKLNTFMNMGESDIIEEEGDDEFMDSNDEFDNFGPLAHMELQQHRERRHYARLAAWDLPLLSTMAKPFEPPTADMPLRFRYTTYMGEHHPAENKVVVEFCTEDMPNLTPIQREKLKKLAGVRYNPETDIIKMSCEMYETQAQNKRYLGDRVDELLKEARDPKDTFEDIPLDTRHHKFRSNPKMPKSWKMTPKRKEELARYRVESMEADRQRMLAGMLIDGAKQIEEAFKPKAAPEVPEMATVSPVLGQRGQRGQRIVGVRR